MFLLPGLTVSLSDDSVFEHHHHFVGQAGIVWLQLNILPLYPSGILQLAFVHGNAGIAVQIAVVTDEQIPRDSPGLRFVVGDVLHPYPGFLHHFPGNGFFRSLSDFRPLLTLAS